VSNSFVCGNVKHSGNHLKTGDEKPFVETPDSFRSLNEEENIMNKQIPLKDLKIFPHTNLAILVGF